MNKKLLGVIAALTLAALACATPDVDAGGATAQSVQQTVIAELTLANIQITPDDSDVTQGAAFVQTAIAAKINATIDASIAGTQTALAPVPIPATITIPAPDTEVQPQPTEEPAQPTDIPPTAEPSNGTGGVSGKLCYPAGFLPALTIYAKNLGDGSVFQQENPENQAQYVMLNLPEGDYYLFAYTHPDTEGGVSIGIGYTEFVQCGLLASCTDHTMIAVPVNAGEFTTDVDICDGYDAGAIPPKP